MRFIIPIPVLLALVFSIGCIAQVPNNGLVVSLIPDPATVLVNGETSLHVDVSNTDVKNVSNVKAEVFNSGLLSPVQDCSQRGILGDMRAGEFRTFFCDFRAPKINQDRVTTTLDVRATYESEFPAYQQLQVISEDEYNNRLASGNYHELPRSYVYSDRNIQMQLDFSDPLPLVLRDGRNYFVRFTITNIGNGFIGNIMPDDVRILQKPGLEFSDEGQFLQSVNLLGHYEPCRLEQVIYPNGNKFPSFVCRIVLPPKPQPPLKETPITDYNFIVLLHYKYEIRQSARVDIIR
jgi:hypothetical protein